MPEGNNNSSNDIAKLIKEGFDKLNTSIANISKPVEDVKDDVKEEKNNLADEIKNGFNDLKNLLTSKKDGEEEEETKDIEVPEIPPQDIEEEEEKPQETLGDKALKVLRKVLVGDE